MSTSLNLYRVSGLSSAIMRQMSDNMTKEAFTREATAGFLVDRASTRVIEARRIHKFVEKETFETPFGETSEFERTVYTEQRFLLQTEWPNLVLFDSRSPSRSFVGRLSEFSDFKIAISEITVNVSDWLKAFRNEFGAVSIYGLKIGQLPVEDSITAKVALEGEGDLFSAISKLLGKRRISFDALKIRFEFGGQVRKCELKSSGSIQIFGDEDTTLLKRCLSSARALSGNSAD